MSSYKVNINVTEHTKLDGHYLYTLKITIDNMPAFIIQKRYSELKSLNDLLKKECSSNNFPKFPPKKFWPSEEIIRKRRQELDVYFKTICGTDEFSQIPSFKKFVDDCLKSQNDNKLLSERPTMIPQIEAVNRITFKSTVNSYRLKYKPEKVECEKLSPDEIKKKNEEYQNIVNDFKARFVNIDFQVKLGMSEKRGKKYNDIIEENKVLNNNGNVEEGNDDNYNLISENNDGNMDVLENGIKQKMEEITKREKEIFMMYDINEILKSL